LLAATGENFAITVAEQIPGGLMRRPSKNTAAGPRFEVAAVNGDPY
jgi:hypothetical protein